MTSKRSLVFSALLVLALAGGTTACGGGSDKKSGDNPTSSSTSPGGSGSSGAGASDGASGGSGSVKFQVTKDVPSDFPTTDVPMIGGTVLNGTKGAFKPSGEQVKGWTVRMKYAKSAADALDAAKARLTSAGFTQEKAKDIPADERAFKSSSYDVRVRAAKTKGGSIVIYTVIPS